MINKLIDMLHVTHYLGMTEIILIYGIAALGIIAHFCICSNKVSLWLAYVLRIIMVVSYSVILIILMDILISDAKVSINFLLFDIPIVGTVILVYGRNIKAMNDAKGEIDDAY